MNLDRLPEIVEAVKVKDPEGRFLTYRMHSGYWWTNASGFTLGCPSPFDAANACVVEMLRRLTKNVEIEVVLGKNYVSIGNDFACSIDTFPGDPLNALYDAFTAHPEWFKEPTNG